MSDIINSNDNYDNQVVSEHTFAGINKYSASQDEMTYFTPEMFGAVGDGVTDDYLAIKTMLEVGPIGCTFVFDGSKTYFNAFGNKKASDPWMPLTERQEWRRTEACNFRFNNAKLTRRVPAWNDNNKNNNLNSGAYYTDDHTALLRLSGGPYIIEDANFDSGIPLGPLVTVDGSVTGQTNYAVGQCMDFGLILDNCADVTIKGGIFKNSVFPVYIDSCDGVYATAVRVEYAAQAAKRVTPTDLAYGGGCKILNSSNISIEVFGYRNVNCTAEIESLNNNVQVKGWSNLDYSNSIVIFGNSFVHVDWTARNVVNGCGVYIRGGFSDNTSTSISGRVIVDAVSWIGCYVYLASNASTDMFGINLDVHTSNCGHHGLYIENQSSTNKIKGLNIRHQSKSDNGGAAATGAPTRWHGLVDGDIWINPTDAYQGFWASGNNTSDAACVVRVHGSIRGATNRWTITSTMCVDIDLVSKTNSYRFTCTQFVDTAAITAGGTFNTNNSYIRTFGRFNQDQTTYSLFPKMKNTVSGSDYELFYDTANHVVVEGGKKYPAYLFIKN